MRLYDSEKRQELSHVLGRCRTSVSPMTWSRRLGNNIGGKRKLTGQDGLHGRLARRINAFVGCQPPKAFYIWLRIRALWVSGREALHGVLGIVGFVYAVNPAKTKCFFNGIVVYDARLAGCLLGIDQPRLVLLIVMLLKYLEL